MADKKRSEAGGNPGNLTGHGSGQQSSGKRGQKQNVDGKKKIRYRSTGPKRESGTHGGNRGQD